MRESVSHPENQSQTHHPHPLCFFAGALVVFVSAASSLNISHDCIEAQWEKAGRKVGSHFHAQNKLKTRFLQIARIVGCPINSGR